MGKWYENPLVWGGAALVVVGAAFEGENMLNLMKDFVGRGEKLTSSTWYDDNEKSGIIREEPESLRALASLVAGFNVPLDMYSLARMIRSEGATQGRARAHVAYNDLAKFPYASNLHGLLTYSTDGKRRGLYGKQWSPKYVGKTDTFLKANARRYSTTKDPYMIDLKTALQIAEERKRGTDPTRGASKFIDIDSMGKQEGSRTFAEVDAEWKASGYKAYSLPEYGNNLVFYRKV